MQQEVTTPTTLDLTAEITSLQGSVTHFQEKWPKMVKRAQVIKAGFSKLSIPKNDKEDSDLEEYLANTRKFLDLTKEDRLSGTKEFDNIKKKLMQPEKELEAIFEQGKSWRNEYAVAKEKRRQEELAEIKRKEDKANEISRIKIEIERSINNGVINQVSQVDSYLSTQYASLSIDNYATVEAVFKKAPTLNQKNYANWLEVNHNTSLVTREEYLAIASELPELIAYPAINDSYSKQVQTKLNEWLPKLPVRLQELKDNAELAKKNKAEADRIAEEQRVAAAAQETERLERERIAAEELKTKQDLDLKQKQEDEKLNNSFNAQIATQSVEDQDGVRKTLKGVLVADEALIVGTMSDVFAAVFSHPKYKGIFEKKKSGELELDENGDFVAVPWVQSLLDFYVKECEYLNEDGSSKIPGLKVKKVLSTVQRSKK